VNSRNEGNRNLSIEALHWAESYGALAARVQEALLKEYDVTLWEVFKFFTQHHPPKSESVPFSKLAQLSPTAKATGGFTPSRTPAFPPLRSNGILPESANRLEARLAVFVCGRGRLHIPGVARPDPSPILMGSCCCRHLGRYRRDGVSRCLVTQRKAAPYER
jgi:hypothetical protein